MKNCERCGKSDLSPAPFDYGLEASQYEWRRWLCEFCAGYILGVLETLIPKHGK